MGITSVQAKFSVDTSGLVAGSRKAVGELEKLNQKIKGLSGQLTVSNALQGLNVFQNVAKGLGAAANGIASFGKSSTEAIDAMAKLSDRTGASYADLKILENVANMSGASFDTLKVALTKSLDVLGRARGGSAEATRAFEAIGLSIEELSGIDAAARFGKIAEAIGGLPDPATRTAAAIRIFGEQGAALLPMFAGSSEAIKRATADLSRFGALLSQDQVAGVVGQVDAWTKLQAAVGGVVDQVRANLAPAVTEVTNMLTTFISDADGVTIGAKIADGLLEGALALAGWVDAAVASFQVAWDNGAALAEGLGFVAEVFTRATDGIAALIRGFQGMLSGAAAVLAKGAELLLTGAAQLAGLLRMKGLQEELQKAGNQAGVMANAMFAKAGEQLEMGAKNAVNAFAGRDGVEQAMTGGVQAAVQAGIDRLRTMNKEIAEGVPVGPIVNGVTDALVEGGEQAGEAAGKRAAAAFKMISGTDSRSTAGMNELIRLTQQKEIKDERQSAVNTKITADAAREIAKNTGWLAKNLSLEGI